VLSENSTSHIVHLHSTNAADLVTANTSDSIADLVHLLFALSFLSWVCGSWHRNNLIWWVGDMTIFLHMFAHKVQDAQCWSLACKCS